MLLEFGFVSAEPPKWGFVWSPFKPTQQKDTHKMTPLPIAEKRSFRFVTWPRVAQASTSWRPLSMCDVFFGGLLKSGSRKETLMGVLYFLG